MRPSCTVIIPTIGRPRHFTQALASVVAQTYEPLDILVSDNAAQPPLDPESLAALVPAQRFRLIRQTQRLEFGPHLNACLRAARGDYAMFLSDDDLLSPGYVAAGMRCFSADPDVRAVLSRQMRIDEHFDQPPSPEPPAYQIMSGDTFLRRWFCAQDSQGVLTTMSMLARRQQMLDVGGFADYPSGAHADIILLVRLGLEAKVGLLNGGFYYRVYASSVGLGMPWRHLVTGTIRYERELEALYRQGKLNRELWRGFVREHSRLWYYRWRTLYCDRSGAGNKVLPLAQLSARLLWKGLRLGWSTLPWRLARRRQHNGTTNSEATLCI